MQRNGVSRQDKLESRKVASRFAHQKLGRFDVGSVTKISDKKNLQRTIVFLRKGFKLIRVCPDRNGAYIAAGSTITDNVPKDALGIARGRQTTKPGWAAAKRKELRAAAAPKKKSRKRKAKKKKSKRN